MTQCKYPWRTLLDGNLHILPIAEYGSLYLRQLRNAGRKFAENNDCRLRSWFDDDGNLHLHKSAIGMSARGKPPKYDWGTILDGRPHMILASECRISSMRRFQIQVYRAAKVRGVGVQTYIDNEGNLFVQARAK